MLRPFITGKNEDTADQYTPLKWVIPVAFVGGQFLSVILPREKITYGE